MSEVKLKEEYLKNLDLLQVKLKSKDYISSLPIIESILQSNNTDSLLYHIYIIILAKNKRFKKLEMIYNKIPKVDQKDINIEYLKNQCLYFKGNYDISAAKTDEYSQLLLQFVNFYRMNYDSIRLYIDQHKNTKAKKALELLYSYKSSVSTNSTMNTILPTLNDISKTYSISDALDSFNQVYLILSSEKYSSNEIQSIMDTKWMDWLSQNDKLLYFKARVNLTLYTFKLAYMRQVNEYVDLNYDIMTDLIEDLNQLEHLGGVRDRLLVYVNLFNLAKATESTTKGLRTPKEYKKYVLNSRKKYIETFDQYQAKHSLLNKQNNSTSEPKNNYRLETLIRLFKNKQYDEGIKIISTDSTLHYNLANFYLQFVERSSLSRIEKVEKHIATLETLCAVKLTIQTIIIIKTIVCKLMSKYRMEIEPKVKSMLACLSTGKQQLPSIHRVRMIVEEELDTLLDFMSALYSFESRGGQLLHRTISQIDASETIGKLPQQFEDVEDEVMEGREWKPAEADEERMRRRRKNKAPKSTYLKMDEERWTPKKDRKKYRKKYKNIDKTQGDA